jgi:hypothetical protein
MKALLAAALTSVCTTYTLIRILQYGLGNTKKGKYRELVKAEGTGDTLVIGVKLREPSTTKVSPFPLASV